MRIGTWALSILVHLSVLASVIVAPILATDALPLPPHTTSFVRVVAAFPREPASPTSSRQGAASVSTVSPVDPPDGMQPESHVQPSPLGRDPWDRVSADAGIETVGDAADAITSLPAEPPASTRAPVRVGGIIRRPQRITDAAPTYPAIARAAHVEGLVILEAVIGEDGSVRDVRVLRSVPLLDAAAMDAVRQWRFSPTLLNGAPVPVVMTVTVAFTLR